MSKLPETVTTPALPFPYVFPLKHTALLLIDLQRDFLLAGGFGDIQSSSSLVSANKCVEPCVRLLEVFRALNLPVIHTREGHPPDLSDCPISKLTRQSSSPSGNHTKVIGDAGPMGRLLVRGEHGHDLIDPCQPLLGETVIDKPGKGAFWATPLLEELRNQGISHLIVGGVTTECCVTNTVKEANDRGLECCIVREATAGYNDSFKEPSLAMIHWSDGLFGFVAGLDEVVGSLQPHIPAKDESAPIASGWNGDLSFDCLSTAFRSGATTPTQVIEGLYPRLAASPPGTWIHLSALEHLLSLAAALETKHGDKSNLPPLYGLPFSIKDSIDLADTPTTVACAPLTTHPTSSAASVQTLISLGAIPVGKTNLDCLATGLTGQRSTYGAPVSVCSPLHISGGSSSGAAVSVGAKLVSFALATDTAGSGRVPAAFNNIVGWKPTKGTLSFAGVATACESLDCLAIMTQRVSEARLVWRLLLSHQPPPAAHPGGGDRMAKHYYYPAVPRHINAPPPATFRFATPPVQLISDLCSPSYAAAFAHILSILPSLGGTPVPTPTWTPFAAAGALLYDGSFVSERLAGLPHNFLSSSSSSSSNLAGLHPVVRDILQSVAARTTKAEDVYRDLHTMMALRAQVRSELEGAVMVCPTAPGHPTVQEIARDPVEGNSRLGCWTHAGNVLDLCAVSVPAGLVGDGGLPFGVMVMGVEGGDAEVLRVAERVEMGVMGVVHEEIKEETGRE